MKFKRMRKIEEAVTSEIDKLSESEKSKLVGECKRMNTTNCGWIMYGLKEIVVEVAKAQLRTLKIKKREKLHIEEGGDFESEARASRIEGALY